MTLPAKTAPASGGIMESVLIKGDLGKLTEHERVSYYSEVCKSMGLNPLTKPFEYITLNGKLQLYALRACTDQLRKINGISLEIVSRDVADGILTVHVRAKTADGRTDEDLGSVAFPDTLKGELRANMELKAVTKAKRRATLSICGLGWLDETEVEDIPSAAPGRRFMNPSHRASPPPVLMPNGEIKTLAEELSDEIPEFPAVAPQPAGAAAPVHSSPQPTVAGAAVDIQTMAREAAMRGTSVFNAFYKARNAADKKLINAIGDELRGLMDTAQ